MPRPTRVQELVAAATKLFNERGFQGTSVRAIAEAVGMRSGGLYTHFPSKEALLYRIVTDANKKIHDAVEAVCESDLDPEAKFRAALLQHVKSNIEVGAASVSRIFVTEWRHLTGPEMDAVLEERRAYEQLWDSIIGEAIDAGVFREDVDRNIARLITLSVGNWAVIMWFNPEGPETVEEVFDKAADELLKGFLAR